MRNIFALALGAFLLLHGPAAFAQSAQAIAAAKKEGGKVILYTSMETFTADALKAAFEKKTGLQMEYWRGGSTEVLDRVLSEHRVGKPGFDVVAITGDHMRLMANDGAIGKYDSPSLKAFAKEAIDPILGARYRNIMYGVIYNKSPTQGRRISQDARRHRQTGISRQIGHAAPHRPYADHPVAGQFG